MAIDYKTNVTISTDAFVDLLERSTLAQRRPVDDRRCMEGMLDNSNLVISAWKSGTLIGIARSVTDFHYACYLSDLAVDRVYHCCGIGKELQRLTQARLGPQCQLILIAAPAAATYYEHIGFKHNPRCWTLDRQDSIRD